MFVEGNYVLLLEEPWGMLQTEGLLDDRIFVDTDLDECAARVFRYENLHVMRPAGHADKCSPVHAYACAWVGLLPL